MKKVLIATIAMLLAGCSTQNYIVSEKVASSTPKYDKMQNFFVQGIAQQQEVDASAICNGAGNTAKVETQQTFLNGLISVLAQGIYTPRDMRVYCK